MRVEPARLLSLDQAIEWLGSDEYLEVIGRKPAFDLKEPLVL